MSEVLSLMLLHPLLKSGWTLKGFCRWLHANRHHLFPNLVEYSRLTRLVRQPKELLMVVLQRLSDPDSFGLVADDTALPVQRQRARLSNPRGRPRKQNGWLQ